MDCKICIVIGQRSSLVGVWERLIPLRNFWSRYILGNLIAKYTACEGLEQQIGRV